MNQEPYLYHHGVKGMKWGVRKKSSEKKLSRKERGGLPSEKRLRKKIQKHSARAYKNPNTMKVYKKAWDEISNTKESKKLGDFLNEKNKKADSNGTYIYNDKERKTIKKLHEDVLNKQKSIFNKYMDEFAGAKLKDLGYKDTQAGRDYLKKLKLV